jgi:hypothetical protein
MAAALDADDLAELLPLSGQHLLEGDRRAVLGRRDERIRRVRGLELERRDAGVGVGGRGRSVSNSHGRVARQRLRDWMPG